MKVDKLRKLIAAMSKNEKRYFKIYAEAYRSGDNNSVRLFDLVEGGMNDDDLKNEILKYSNNANLSSHKNYLFELLLESLFECHSADDIETQLFRKIKYADQLRSKGLYKEAIELCKDAKEEANAKADYVFSGMAALKQREIHIASWADLDEQIEVMNNELYDYLRKLKNKEQYRLLWYQINRDINNKMFVSYNDNLIDLFKHYINHKMLNNEKYAIAPISKVLYNLINGLIQKDILNNNPKSISFTKAAINYFDEDRELLDGNQRDYIVAVSNYFFPILFTKNKSLFYREFEFYQNKIAELKSLKPHLLNMFTKNMLVFKTAAHCVFADITDVSKVMKENKATIQLMLQSGPKGAYVINLHFGYLYFLVKDYKNSIKHLGQILNNKDSFKRAGDFRPEILQIMSFYDKGDELFAQKLLTEFKDTYLSNPDFANKTIETFCPLMEGLLKSKKETKLVALKKTLPIFKNIEGVDYHSSGLYPLSIARWIESKIK
ncbi:MAG: hypothetical protein J0M08_12305 [Bacteroidetes bacterium]|nr:hypothetical protein [Bacteroidota bacterium]